MATQAPDSFFTVYNPVVPRIRFRVVETPFVRKLAIKHGRDAKGRFTSAQTTIKQNIRREFGHTLLSAIKETEDQMRTAMSTPGGSTDKTLSARKNSPLLKTIGHVMHGSPPFHKDSNWKPTLKFDIGALYGDPFWQMIAQVHNDGTTITTTGDGADKLAIPIKGGEADRAYIGTGSGRRRKPVGEVMAKWKRTFATERSISYSQGRGKPNKAVYMRRDEVVIKEKGIITDRAKDFVKNLRKKNLNPVIKKAFGIGK